MPEHNRQSHFWPHIPKTALNDRDTRVLLQLQRVRGRCTIRQLAGALGLSVTPTFDSLRYLRDLGLVDWVDGQMGTLHTTSAPVAINFDGIDRTQRRVRRPHRPVNEDLF